MEQLHNCRVATATGLQNKANRRMKAPPKPEPVLCEWPCPSGLPSPAGSSLACHVLLVFGRHQQSRRHTFHADGDG